jgi:RNA polymerase sigma factor (TIGR02999 family)
MIMEGGESSPDSEASAQRLDSNKLFASLYADLRELAERQLKRNGGKPLSPTTLLHEAYIGMAGRDSVFPDRERFLGYAARVMRGLIIDFVRDRRALKRGAGFHITELPTEIGATAPNDLELSQLSDSLDELAAHEPRLAEVVDLKYFCGYTTEEIAAQRGGSVRAVERDWTKARLLLFDRMKPV